MEKHRNNSGRWYDQYPNICDLVKLSEELPRSVQENIGENLISNIHRYQSMAYSETELKSMGTEAVLTLYKSYKKQRWYDTIPQMHKALNLLIALPEPVLHHFDARCANLVEYIRSQKANHTFNPSYMALKVNSFLNTSERIEIREQSSHLIRPQKD